MDPAKLDYGLFRYASKAEVLEKSARYWNPGKTRFWQRRRHRPRDRPSARATYLHDMDGRRLIDLHINGGTYNLGHRNPELIATLQGGARPFRHRQPPLPLGGAHRAGRGAGDGLARHGLRDLLPPAAARRSTSR